MRGQPPIRDRHGNGVIQTTNWLLGQLHFRDAKVKNRAGNFRWARRDIVLDGAGRFPASFVVCWEDGGLKGGGKMSLAAFSAALMK